MSESPLVAFKDGFRRIWMFPRNIRTLYPWKVYQVLKILMQCEGLDMSSPEEQEKIYSLLDECGVKRQAKTRDSNPGGMRTYVAQMRALGLIYKTKDKTILYTIAGEKAKDEEVPLKVIQYQLLRHQYPSAYGMGSQVGMHPDMKVKPFLFILKLLHDSRLEYTLTDSDVMIPVIYGHNNACYELCVQKILKLRETKDINSVIDDPIHDLYTKKGNLDKALDNIANIANTAMNYLIGPHLIEKFYNTKLKVNGYMMNSLYEDMYESFMEEFDDFIPIKSIEDEESFQRAYGRYDKLKDTRSQDKVKEPVENGDDFFIRYKFVDYINTHTFAYDDDLDFLKNMENFGFSNNKVAEAIAPYKAKRRSMEENIYLEYANSGGEFADEFEKATTNIFKQLGFSESYWIGRRKSKQNWRGNFADILVKRKDIDKCAFVDTKASSVYSLGHADMLKMKDTYVGSEKELAPGCTLQYFVYVAGGFKGDIDKSVNQLSSETHIPVTALTANAILNLLRMKQSGLTTDEIESEFFLQGGYFPDYEIQYLCEELIS